MVIWYIFPVLVPFTKKNLATLLGHVYCRADKSHIRIQRPLLETKLCSRPGTDVMIFEIFSPKCFGENIGIFDSKQNEILQNF
jgi:hypothetical protein